MDDLVTAEDDIERAWCDLDRAWHRLLREARHEAAAIVHEAEVNAARIVRDAHAEADLIVADARSAPVAAAAVEDPTGIREALGRLRSELSHVVDAALDAFPAIEATAELFAPPEPEPLVIDLTEPEPVVDVVPARPRGLRRLLRLAR
jgi:hypothetical protein